MAKNKILSNKRLKLVTSLLAVVAIMMALGFAWYTLGERHTDTEEMEIMTPYALYLLNSGATDTLELNVGGIHPGEKKEIVVCVSSHDANAKEEQTSKEGIFPYTLELVHTDNIGLTYNMYPLTPMAVEPEIMEDYMVASTYTVLEGNVEVARTRYFEKGSALTGDTSVTDEYRAEMYGADNVASIVNQGTYCVYSEDDFKLSLNDETKRYNYFLIEIQWNLGEEETEQKSKETDLVYLVAKAGVPKPVEITDETQESNP